MKQKKRTYKRLLWLLLLVFVVLNGVTLFHAWKLTHFDAAATRKIENAYGLSTGEKLGLVLTGADMPRPKNKAKPARPYEVVRLQSNKAIECWYIARDSAKGTVALFHGYGGEKSGMLDKAEVFYQLGYNTLLVDFMGAGGSEGVQTTIGYKEAEQVKTCVDYLQQRGVKNIILFGTSMGAAAVMKAMDDQPLPVRALVLECPFSTMLQTVKNRFAMMGAPSFPLAQVLVFWGGALNGFNAFAHDPADYARSITTPTLLLWGEKDERVKREETEEIFNHLAGPKKLVTYPEAGHENYLTKYKEQWTEDVAQFLNASKP
ncbi:MAG TPA: alpha/beta fold hydrolase [Chitinophagaceae bacterium]